MMTHDSDSLSLAPCGPSLDDLPAPPPLIPDAQTAVFLDFDGTLVEIAPSPDGVDVPPALAPMLTRLERLLEGRLAVVSGRSLTSLDALLGSVPVAMAGSHGGEFRDGDTLVALASPFPEAIAARLSQFAAEHGGLLAEAKPFSMAVHYRHHPEARDALLRFAATLAEETGVKLTHGKQVVELSSPGSDKGSALKRFMGLPRFAGSCPIFLGDDITDEDAFGVIEQFGGHGVLVGPPRGTAAAWRLPDVAAVHAWLRAGLDSAAG